MEFKSYADLEADVVRMLPNLPRDLDLIVAVPRSGLVPASMIALHLNLPVTDLEGLFDGRLIASGHRKLRKSVSETDETPLKVLIVDDSVGTGAQMREIRAELERRALPHRIQIAVIYATPTGAPLVDFYGKTVPVLRHFFAWNVMHHSAINQWCVDIDGVLCRDCTLEEDDEAERYARFLHSAEPLYLPTSRIGWLVTGRLEKYRAVTETWLHKHGITYDKLIMHPADSNAERKANGGIGHFKGNFYKSIDSGLFIESCAWQAKDIANASGKPVLCMETRSMIQPNTTARLRKIARKGPGSYFRFVRRLFENYRDQNRNAGFVQGLQTTSGTQIQKNEKC
ncbi:phosphoribosyl transferase-like protein [Roseinatronobacter bogoriensis subsp. barguzinensis]|uniref:Orotate phosphoribosyltransferase n=2 Tax=Roseinatronobacter bogoriensis TaxID=119542 RepID=A0A2K8K5E1_9RHOB|nr:orotate phosphoribosyltransferase [Rhodobaca barguzinensis]TDW35146.1 phosphoribosyl transferase-like protein [Rhodobaca barguzinensis]TDY66844.1 phosphoribosyl transferase-like protein [Rhodobaca bogoriensis DSM 18756]